MHKKSCFRKSFSSQRVKKEKYWTWEISLKYCGKFYKLWEYENIKDYQGDAENSFFLFLVLSEKEVKNIFKDLLISKSTISGDILAKILKQHTQIFSKKLTGIFNESIKIDKLPNFLYEAEVTPVYKKNDMNDNYYYRPVNEYIIQSTTRFFL